jgi:hypothetical protein
MLKIMEILMAPKSYATQFTRDAGSGEDYAWLFHPDQA